MVAPEGTPREVANKLHAAIARVMKTPTMKQRLEPLGAEVIATTPEEFTAYVAAEDAKWAQVVKAADIKPE